MFRGVVSSRLALEQATTTCQFQQIRCKSKWLTRCRFHEHISFSKPRKYAPRPPKIDPKFLKIGEPISGSLALKDDMVQSRRFQWDMDSLNARGFLRFQKPYTPPEDAVSRAMNICRTCLNSNEPDEGFIETKLSDPKVKFELLTKASEEFQHAVPNSMLHMVTRVKHVIRFYNTPVKTTTPFEELVRNKDLPGNLYIQKEPVRFNAETDTKFGGQTAFTKSSGIITGLRAKKIYKGHQAKMTWP